MPQGLLVGMLLITNRNKPQYPFIFKFGNSCIIKTKLYLRALFVFVSTSHTVKEYSL